MAATGQAQAASVGVTGEKVSDGFLPEIVRAKLKGDESSGFEDGTDVGRILVIKYTVAPGGSFGWHRHGGPVWAVIMQGTLTMYDGDDPTCTGTDYAPLGDLDGDGFVDGTALLDAGDHLHNAVNHGDIPVVVYATFMLPDGAPTKIDAPNPGFCPF